MHSTDLSDFELLQRYARRTFDGEAAFATLVERHLNLVYSVALRHVHSRQLAEDVAQSVFMDLSRQAARFDPNTPLVAWLHLVSRRTAVDAIRRETRRHAREQAAADLAMKPTVPSPDWRAIEPLLDEAVESLPPPDRAAILLRYFENKSLRDIGTALGTSDDAAQKRVARALDRLHAFLRHRGVIVTAAGLASDLSAHALHTAPIGLGGSVCAAVGTAGPAAAGTALEAGRVIVMTTLQKSGLAGAFLLVGTAGLYQGAIVASQSSELAALRRETSRGVADLEALRASRASMHEKLEAVERRIDARLAVAPASAADAALEAQMRKWLAQIDRLKQLLPQNPAWDIPELKLLTDDDWFSIASTAQLDGDAALRRATSTLRHRAENMFAQKLHEALQAFTRANDGTLPDSMSLLVPFLDPAIDPALLARYELSHQGRVSELSPTERLRVITVKSPADVELDAFWWIGVDGYGNTSAMSHNVSEARRRFAEANPGQRAVAAVQLAPHLKWPVAVTQLQQYLDRVSAPRR